MPPKTKVKDPARKKARRTSERDAIESESMQQEGGSGAQEQTAWMPGQHEMGEDEELQVDNSAYTSLHKLSVEWPCMSFAIVRDQLGAYRTKWPQSMYLVTGTQAASNKQNKLMVLKVSNLQQTQHDDEDKMEEDSDGEEGNGLVGSDADSDDEPDKEPVLEEKWIKHDGVVNRIRVMPQKNHLVATWSENSHVYMWDTSSLLKSLDDAKAGPLLSKPLQTFTGHTQEGYALDWSPVTPGRFVSGDCAALIYLWEPTPAGDWAVQPEPYRSHTGSVEDLQWSPVERTVFASCSADRTVRIWDTRAKEKKSQLFIAAHQTDVNVLAWSPKVSHLMATGADDGSIRVWDLRQFKSAKPVASYKWHRGAVTSVEWHPHDETVLAAASEDHTVSVWDMALEEDKEAEAQGASIDGVQVPDQLLFLHQGQKSIKELHFHPQIPSLIVSTALDGFNFFKPSNMLPLTLGRPYRSNCVGTRSRRLAEFEANHAMQTSSSSPISRSIANFQSLGAVPISMLAVSHFVVHVGIVAEGLELVQY
eukprot:g41545.t1